MKSGVRCRCALRFWIGPLVLPLFAAFVPAVSAKSANETRVAAAKAEQRVRFGFKLTKLRRVGTGDGGQERVVRDKTYQHTLRAKLYRPNHFYFGEWHIETKPEKIVNQTGFYQVGVTIYYRDKNGANLEERLGSFSLFGKLVEQDPGLYVLQGSAAKRFRTKTGEPLIDVVAGLSSDAPGVPAPRALSRSVPRKIEKPTMDHKGRRPTKPLPNASQAVPASPPDFAGNPKPPRQSQRF